MTNFLMGFKKKLTRPATSTYVLQQSEYVGQCFVMFTVLYCNSVMLNAIFSGVMAF